MTYTEFVNKYLGTKIDYDGVYGVQCVDLIKQYLKSVFSIAPGSWGNAHCYYDNFSSISSLKNNFTRVAYSSGSVPPKGSIVVWSTKISSGGTGHIAIGTGEGNSSYFYSYDQNWGTAGSGMKKTKHTYSCVLGWLVSKNASTETTTTTSSTSTSTYKTGTYTLTANMNVRTGAGTSSSKKKYSQLTADGKKHAVNKTASADAILAKGTTVTVKTVKKLSATEYWGEIPSGWICLCKDGKTYVK